MISGQGSLSIKKSDLTDQKLLATGYVSQYFAHKAAAGATSINLNSLTVPPEMVANGFANPTSSQLASANLLFFQNNLTLTSSLRGLLQKNLSYVITGSTNITLLFSALEGEIFSGVINQVALSGLKVVDATATPASGTMVAGTNTFNIGNPLQTNKYPSTSIGAVLVHVDGALQHRNTGNSSTTTDGQYFEVDNGGGSFSTIQFNITDPDNDRYVVVTPNGLLSERPDGSMMAVIESLAGQVNSMAAYVASLAGVTPASITGAAPTNVDLSVFGNAVIALQQTRAQLGVSNVWTANQSIPGNTSGAAIAAGYPGEVKTSTSVGTPVTLTTSVSTYDLCSGIPLTAGIWILGFANSYEGNVTGTRFTTWIGTAPGNNTAGFVAGQGNWVDGGTAPLTANDVTQTLFGWVVYVPAGTTSTQYLKGRALFSSGTLFSEATLTAVRLV